MGCGVGISWPCLTDTPRAPDSDCELDRDAWDAGPVWGIKRTGDDGRRDEPANPVYNGPRWFSCTAARRIKLKLHQSRNFIYHVAEVELGGYDHSVDGPCVTRCRHGGTCLLAAHDCICVSKFGWRGEYCDIDVDECSVCGEACHGAEPETPTTIGNVQYHLATVAVERSISRPNGGCSRGGGIGEQAEWADCTNSYGSWCCSCRSGFEGEASVGTGNICTDVNECLAGGAGHTVTAGGCAHICLNNDGGYTCGCRTGWSLNGDGRSCDAICARPCLHHGKCTAPELCTGCDTGWSGSKCEIASCEMVPPTPPLPLPLPLPRADQTSQLTGSSPSVRIPPDPPRAAGSDGHTPGREYGGGQGMLPRRDLRPERLQQLHQWLGWGCVRRRAGGRAGAADGLRIRGDAGGDYGTGPHQEEVAAVPGA